MLRSYVVVVVVLHWGHLSCIYSSRSQSVGLRFDPTC